jgi:ABC-type uncharacterized transport system permease subunit
MSRKLQIDFNEYPELIPAFVLGFIVAIFYIPSTTDFITAIKYKILITAIATIIGYVIGRLIF